ncbi:uncharacterized protein [Amphiura filiformis]|uniref:uncharacterized protein n=1 Tax=Amphiura filiformis TaxID=82378 RepID=UPI003B2283BC
MEEAGRVQWVESPNQLSGEQSSSQTIPIILHLTTNEQTITSPEKKDVETQTIQWELLLHASIQKYLEHQLKSRLQHTAQRSACVHKWMTFEDMLTMVEERHNAVCIKKKVISSSKKKGQVHAPVLSKKTTQVLQMPVDDYTATEFVAEVMVDLHAQYQDNLQHGNGNVISQTQVVQVPADEYTVTEAAADVMAEVINAQHQDISPHPANSVVDGQPILNNATRENASKSGTSKTKILYPKRKRARERLIQKGVKIIECDPPDRIERAKKLSERKNFYRNNGKHIHIPSKVWFQCAKCGAKLEDLSKLERHAATHETNNLRPYACKRCGRTYKTQEVLQKHVEFLHGSKQKIFKISCHHCGKGFRDQVSCDNHVRIHTGETPYSCTHCDRSFRANKSLTMHLKRLHKIGKIEQCPLCNCTYPSMHPLHNHLASIHKAQVPQIRKGICVHKCLICEKEVADEQSLLQHILEHGNPDCSRCEKRKQTQERLQIAKHKERLKNERKLEEAEKALERDRRKSATCLSEALPHLSKFSERENAKHSERLKNKRKVEDAEKAIESEKLVPSGGELSTRLIPHQFSVQ